MTNHQIELDNLINNLKDSGFLTDKKTESAFRNIPRHKFVLSSDLDKAYYNKPLGTMKNQTISQPAVVSRMTEWLDIKKGQKILEIGTGSGWQAGIISYLAGNGIVYSIERHAKLADFAKENLQRLGIDNARIISGDGSMGYPAESPFDRIIVTAACNKVPSPLFAQLGENGLLLAPVGSDMQSLVLFQKTGNKIIEIKREPNYVFVPLLGKFGNK